MYKSAVFILLGASLLGACSESAKTESAITHEAPNSNVLLGDNSQNALDWPGVYEGVLPCASCEGMQTRITLTQDNGVTSETIYLGKDEKIISERGSITWDEQGQKITLPNGSQYLVGENQLFMLDTQGNRITGDLASHYILKKK